MRYLLLIFVLVGFNSLAFSSDCPALDAISFEHDDQKYLYGELKSEIIEVNSDIRLPVPKINGANFVIDDISNSAISLVKGSNVKKISVTEVTSQKSKKLLEQLFSIIQSQDISELGCALLSELLELTGDINNKLGVNISSTKHEGSKVIELFGKSTFESPLLINRYVLYQQKSFFIVDVYSQKGLYQPS